MRHSNLTLSLSIAFSLMACWISISRAEPSADFKEIVSKSRAAVVTIRTYNAWGKPAGSGTGFFVRRDGLLVTCAHVIQGAHRVEVKLGNGSMFVNPTLVAANTEIDIALLQVGGEDLSALPLRSSLAGEEVSAGDQVVVIGNPLGAFEGTVSTGIISNVWQEEGWRIYQTTAAISPGSSGSPLMDMNGFVIGVINQTAVEGQNINFAVAADHVFPLLSDSQANPLLSNAASLSSNANQAYLLGIWARSTMNPELAETKFLEAIQIDPNHINARIAVADLYYERGSFELQKQSLEEAARRFPNESAVFHNLGLAYETVGLEEDAILAYQKALTINPQHMDTLYNLAFLHILGYSFDEAVPLIERLRNVQPRYASQLARLIGMLQTPSTAKNPERRR